MKFFFIALCILATVNGCGNNTNGALDSTSLNEIDSEQKVQEIYTVKPAHSALLAENIFNQERRKIADQIISIFENDNPKIQYDYVKSLNDGRGITAGRAGFTSATADMLEVIERYSAIVPKNSLAVYIPRLKELAKTEDSSTDGLEGLEKAWKDAAKHSAFRKVQDDVVDDYYFNSALKYASQLSVSLPITLLNLYDAAIQHGDGDDADSLRAMISRASVQAGGTPKNGIAEKQWVQAFMNVRRSTLMNPANKETQVEWIESVGRVDALIKLFQSGNIMLTAPVKINPWGSEFSLPAN